MANMRKKVNKYYVDKQKILPQYLSMSILGVVLINYFSIVVVSLRTKKVFHCGGREQQIINNKLASQKMRIIGRTVKIKWLRMNTRNVILMITNNHPICRMRIGFSS